jgi:hypothetical protein
MTNEREVDFPNDDIAFARLEGFLGESQHTLKMTTECEVRHRLPFMIM